MDYPTVESRNTGYSNSLTTNHSINMPANISAGDVLIVVITFRSLEAENNIGWTAGWNKVVYQSYNTSRSAIVLTKVAAGSDTLTVTTASSRYSAHVSLRLSDAGAVSGTGSTGDPPEHDTGKQLPYIWLAMYCSSYPEATSAPANYSNLTVAQFGGPNSCNAATAERERTIDKEQPGAFSSTPQISFTVSVAPSVLPATVTTSAVSNITHNSAQANGNITNAGIPDPDERGFVYGTTSKSDPGDTAPTSSGYDSYKNETGTYSTGTYNLTLTSLTADQTYYVRAYAHNSAGYAYGDEVSFTTGIAESFTPALLDLYPLSFSDEVKWLQGFSPALLVVRGQKFTDEILDTVTVLTDTAIIDSNIATLRGIFSGLGVTTRGFYLWDETWDYPPEA